MFSSPNSKSDLYAAEAVRLQEHHEFVPLSRLADAMNVSLQAASVMIERLVKDGLAIRTPYKGIRLTSAGERCGLMAIRRHRIAEIYLVRVMGFGWDEVHELTDSLHLGINQIIEDRMFELAGRPDRCPHGEPIPTREGVLPRLKDTSLVKTDDSKTVKISRVRANDPEKLRYFAELGLKPGAELTVMSRSPFSGPIRISISGREYVIGFDLAAALWVFASR